MTALSTLYPDMFLLLTQQGYGTFGTTLFKGPRAVLPDALPLGARAFITLIRTGGQGDEGTHNLSRDTIAYERPSVQITVRAYKPQDAEDVAFELYSDVFNFYDRFINGTWWRSCGPKQEPFEQPVDEKGRAIYRYNLETVKRVSPATS
jgi:hypothetical protein